MKDFAIRHPFITFFIVSDLFVCVQNCVAIAFGRKEVVETPVAQEILDTAVGEAKGTVIDIKEALDESAKSNDISE